VSGVRPRAGARVSVRVQADVWVCVFVGPVFPGEQKESVMKNFMSKLVRDEQGGEVLEYALIAGLIVVAAIAVIGAVGTKVVARWTSLNSSM
jgi:pilus assembly protein Flp/PilA